jgi:hypothetical protein
VDPFRLSNRVYADSFAQKEFAVDHNVDAVRTTVQ